MNSAADGSVMDVESNRDRCDLYEFSQFVLDVRERDLTCGATRIHLAPKTFEVLVALVARPRQLVTKRELLDRVWPDVFVAEGILTVHVAALRRALGDTRQSPAYIETVSRSGSRFIAEVKYLTAAEAATRGVRRCWRASSRGELTTSGGTAIREVGRIGQGSHVGRARKAGRVYGASGFPTPTWSVPGAPALPPNSRRR